MFHLSAIFSPRVGTARDSLSLSLPLPLSLPHAFFNLELEKLTPPLAQKEKTTSATL